MISLTFLRDNVLTLLSKDDKIYATSGWSGACNLFDSENLNPIIKLIGHEERLNSVNNIESGKAEETIKNSVKALEEAKAKLDKTMNK